MTRLGLLPPLVLALAGCTKRPPPDARPAAADASTTRADLEPVDAAVAPAPPRPMNVVLLTVDSLRADMPWAGYPRAIAPRLTELHARSVSYTRAYSTSSFTSKSVAGFLTGKVPSELARTGTFFTKYLDPKDFFCTTLGEQGIPCVGAHAHAYFGKGQSGFENGFATWRLVPDIPFDYQTDPYVTSDKLTPLAIEVLTNVARETSSSGRPFFAWFHYMDPHDEYKPHPGQPAFGTRARDLYDGEVLFTDTWIGKLLDFIESQPWAPRTAIVVTADHGEAFGEHNMTRHAHELWEELVHVPLFFAVPGAVARTIDTPRGHADLVPTFAELLGAKTGELRGTSLVPELRGGPAEARDVLVDLPEDDYNERRRALIHETWKIVAYGNDVRFSLFDLEADPKESEDLFWKRRDVAEDMRRRYRQASKAVTEKEPRGGVPGKDAGAKR